MGYLDMMNLAADLTYNQRVTYALQTFIAKVDAEATTVASHAQRLSWTIKASGNMTYWVTWLITQMGQNTTIITDVNNAISTGKTGATQIDPSIPDTDIQSVVESVATTAATQPTSYNDYLTMSADTTFQNRIKSAIAEFANVILAEPATTAGHATRYAWARSTAQNLFQIVQAIALPVALDANVTPSMYGVSDANLQTAVQDQVTNLYF